jgi:hypothetical protein
MVSCIGKSQVWLWREASRVGQVLMLLFKLWTLSAGGAYNATYLTYYYIWDDGAIAAISLRKRSGRSGTRGTHECRPQLIHL